MKAMPTGLVLLAAAALLTAAAPAPAAEPADHGAAPDFTLPAHAGGEVNLGAVLARGPVILEFWATWCAPCRRALPHLQTLQDRYGERGLSVLTVSQDDPRSQPKIGAFLRAHRLSLPVLLDSDRRAARLYRVINVPATFLISPAGRITAVQRGYRDGDERLLEAALLALLDARAPGEDDAGTDHGEDAGGRVP